MDLWVSFILRTLVAGMEFAVGVVVAAIRRGLRIGAGPKAYDDMEEEWEVGEELTDPPWSAKGGPRGRREWILHPAARQMMRLWVGNVSPAF